MSKKYKEGIVQRPMDYKDGQDFVPPLYCNFMNECKFYEFYEFYEWVLNSMNFVLINYNILKKTANNFN